ncbi:MAG TPA: hypothetical protein VHX61_10990 [Rhizomicrobium sp.]|jgi:hypothetical protein|nr:hypothetical protein [Rhizomicrobium sp.]
MEHGFVRAADGTITSFDPTGSTGTYASSIGNDGRTTGYYIDGSGAAHGFVRAGDGKIMSFDPPGSTGTYGQAIDSSPADKNAIAGFYDDSEGLADGFVRTR